VLDYTHQGRLQTFTTATVKSPESGRLELVALARVALGKSSLESTQALNGSTFESSHRVGEVQSAAQTQATQSTSDMTAVERQVPPMSFLGEKMTDAPASHFTAVNGRDSGTNASAGPHTNGHYRRDSIDKPQPQNRSLSPRPERMTAAANSSWPPPLNGVSARPQEQQYSHSANTAESEKSHKRKRSGSEET
jgi:hypothetical protein